MSSSESDTQDYQGPQDIFYPYFDYIALIDRNVEEGSTSEEETNFYEAVEQAEEVLPPLLEQEEEEQEEETRLPVSVPVEKPLKAEDESKRPQQRKKRVRFNV